MGANSAQDKSQVVRLIEAYVSNFSGRTTEAQTGDMEQFIAYLSCMDLTTNGVRSQRYKDRLKLRIFDTHHKIKDK
jgi:hypothetical protein